MMEQFENKFSRYEVARILGARSLQLAMDAPVLLKLTKEDLEEVNYNPLSIAEKELSAGVLPITVKRPLPQRSEKEIKQLSKEEIKEKLEKQAEKEAKELEEEKKKIEIEEETEKEIQTEGGEIMEMANPDDETEQEETPSEEIQ
jgi:DNA-directed RNA polymerase subunit K